MRKRKLKHPHKDIANRIITEIESKHVFVDKTHVLDHDAVMSVLKNSRPAIFKLEGLMRLYSRVQPLEKYKKKTKKLEDVIGRVDDAKARLKRNQSESDYREAIRRFWTANAELQNLAAKRHSPGTFQYT